MGNCGIHKMGFFRHRPDGNHDLAEISTKRLKELVEYYKERLKEGKSKIYTQMLRKYDYELRRRPDYK